MVKQLFQDCFFQADPSPGNILVVNKDTIGFVDFGAMGSISHTQRKTLMDMLVGIALRDIDKVMSSLLEMSEIEGELDKKALKRDILGLLDYYHDEKPTVYDVQLADSIIELSRKYNIRLPADFTLLERALFETESTCRILDPDFDLIKASWPIIQEITLEKAGPKEQVQELFQVVRRYENLLKFLPGRVDKILKKIEAGELNVKMDVRGATHLETKLENIVKRIEFGIIIMAMIIAVTLVYISEKSMGTNVFILLLFIILASWLIINFFRNIKYENI
jgi:ubiquinone biosynthesis protein